MPLLPPPERLDREPARHVLPTGTRLWRTHPVAHPAVAFESPQDRVFGGRRFDGTTTNGYCVLYASPGQVTAVAERVLPEFDLNPAVPRMLHHARLDGEVLSALETTADLPLLRLLSSADLAGIHADIALLVERDGLYPVIREWGAWLRREVPWAAGIIWQSMVDIPNPTLVLFAERCSGLVRELPELRQDLGGPEPAGWLVDAMTGLGVETRTPPRAKPLAFLNYRTGDGDGTVLLLHDELSRRFGERRVFRDTNSIQPGSDYRPALMDGVRTSGVVLAVIGRNWERATGRDGNRLLDDPEDWVRKEILLAWENGVDVIPVLVGTRQRLQLDDLPEALAELAFTQYLHLPHGAGESEVRALIDRLLRLRPDLT